MFAQLRVAVLMLLAFSVLTGIVYPTVITITAQVLFHHQANGSMIVHGAKTYGSNLIGQPFDDARYFWGRHSATGPFPYNAASSSGSNLAVSNPSQIELIAQRVRRLREADPGNTAPIPADLVTASGSGLDPHISVAAARFQMSRVEVARNLNAAALEDLIRRCTLTRQLGLLGEPRVNVLKLNLLLDHPEWREIPHSSKGLNEEAPDFFVNWGISIRF